VDRDGHRVNKRGYLINGNGCIVLRDGTIVFTEDEVDEDGEIPAPYCYLKKENLGVPVLDTVVENLRYEQNDIVEQESDDNNDAPSM
jgi:hypothetical protein